MENNGCSIRDKSLLRAKKRFAVRYIIENFIRVIGPVIFVYVLLRIDYKAFLSIASNVKVNYLLFAILLNIPIFSLAILRWYYLLRIQKIDYQFKTSAIVYLSSFCLGLVTPGKIGEFSRAIYLKNDDKVSSFGAGISSVLVDRLFDLYLLILLGSLGLMSFSLFKGLSVIVLVALGTIPIILTNRRFGKFFLNKGFRFIIPKKYAGRIDTEFEDFYSNIEALANIRLIIPIMITLVGNAMSFFQFYITALSLNIQISYINIVVFMSLATLVMLLPISIAGIGTRDATFVYLLSTVGIRPELGLSCSVLIFLVFYVVSGAIGAIAYWMKPIAISSTTQSK